MVWNKGELTVVDDAVFQQRLTQVDTFLLVACLADFHQPGHKLAGEKKQYHTETKSILLFNETNVLIKA